MRYSRIDGPATGLGLTTRVAVTVVAPNGSTSDPLTRSTSILPWNRARMLARSFRGVRVWIRHRPLTNALSKLNHELASPQYLVKRREPVPKRTGKPTVRGRSIVPILPNSGRPGRLAIGIVTCV
jgi:hypothetical protein